MGFVGCILGIGGVERDPQKDELRVGVVSGQLGTLQPAQRAMNSQAEIGMKPVTEPALLRLQGLKVEFFSGRFGFQVIAPSHRSGPSKRAFPPNRLRDRLTAQSLSKKAGRSRRPITPTMLPKSIAWVIRLQSVNPNLSVQS